MSDSDDIPQLDGPVLSLIDALEQALVRAEHLDWAHSRMVAERDSARALLRDIAADWAAPLPPSIRARIAAELGACAKMAEHDVEAMRAKCEAIARERVERGITTEADERAEEIADAIASLKGKP
jgi:hypothetical protein